MMKTLQRMVWKNISANEFRLELGSLRATEARLGRSNGQFITSARVDSWRLRRPILLLLVSELN
ncbi:MAG: hypothetical protein QOF94_1381 [Acidobacteriaceae bacterium]|jgi:hypothetical protein